jgi:hypothetical protein
MARGLGQIRPVATRGFSPGVLRALGEIDPGGVHHDFAGPTSERLRRVPLWLWLVSGASVTTAAVLYSKRERLALAIEEAGGDVFDAAATVVSETAEEAVTAVTDIARSLAGALPAAAQPYADLIEKVTARHPSIRPSWTVALGMRESKWGTSPGYKPKGPSGTGDWVARQGSWLSDKNAQAVNVLPAGWSKPKGSSPPWAIPKDALGWGRGLMQIDYGNTVARRINWSDAEANIDAGLTILGEALSYFATPPKTPTVKVGPAAAKRRGVSPGTYPDKRPLAGEDLLAAAIAAYNQGALNSLISLAVGVDVDATTTGKDYSENVIAMADSIESALTEGTA